MSPSYPNILGVINVYQFSVTLLGRGIPLHAGEWADSSEDIILGLDKLVVFETSNNKTAFCFCFMAVKSVKKESSRHSG